MWVKPGISSDGFLRTGMNDGCLCVPVLHRELRGRRDVHVGIFTNSHRVDGGEWSGGETNPGVILLNALCVTPAVFLNCQKMINDPLC